MLMTDEHLTQIRRRADRYITWYGLPLSRDDVADLIAEVSELRAQRAHLLAQVRQSLWELGRLGTPAGDLVSADELGLLEEEVGQ